MPVDSSKNKKIMLYYFLVAALIVIIAFLIFGKACVTSFRDGKAWRKIAETQVRDSVFVPATRGNIYSINHELMATTESEFRLYVDFMADGIKRDTLRKYLTPLAVELNKMFPQKSVAAYENHILKGWNERSLKSREYRLLDHNVNYLQLKAIRKMSFFNKGTYKSGLYSREYVKRTKPYGTLASRTIGDIYGEFGKGGKNGLELQYDELLSGQAGTSTRRKVNGKWINVIDVKPVTGKDVVSTIDINIQDITEKALLNKLKALDAESGTAVVMDVATGEVRAITNLGRVHEGVWGETKNYAVSDMSAPGSTFKVVSMMVMLDSNLITPDDSVNVGNGVYQLPGNKKIKDHNANRGGYGQITASKSIRYSSNIGVGKLVTKVYGHNPSDYIDAIYRIGFQKDMHLEIPGYAVSYIPHPKDTKRYWSGTDLFTMSYGYVTQIPPIYTLSFFNAIANDGKLMKPLFVKEIQEQGKTIEKKKTEVINKHVCSSSTLKEIRQMLDDVVNTSDGTGKPARSEKVRIAGKTGTAQLQDGGGGHQVSFCGYFPSDDPIYSCIVVIRKPRNGNASGGLMCGTVFKEIAEEVYAKNIIYNAKTFPTDTIHPLEPVIKSSIPEEITNHVPNVKGMGAKDAVFALERAGLRVNLFGKGTVVAQSIPAGTNVVKGQTIAIQLKY
ncbi:penicillin-binding protein [Bacteroidia bacterium]|nr:penicillin-binding protein [Bacteroidia bacterium]